ncbi:MAG: GDP-mannose 4,6-dehydratase [Candidatus Omnitrophica bacterium]|nr:GDP-mannose 4,6-dehydratase [Candidatus Omnitrophota bacterium]
MTQRILITGATGMIGAAFIRRALADGHEVTVMVRRESNRLRLIEVESSLRLHDGDVTDAQSVANAVDAARPEVVVHLASSSFNPPTISAQTHWDAIGKGTLIMLEILRSWPQTRFVMTGSAAAYGSGARLTETQPLRPATALGAAKATASIWMHTYARLYGIQAVELRLFMPYGPWEHPRRLIPQTILSALAGEELRTTDGRQQRDLVYVDDVVDALLLAATRPVAAGSVFNIGSGIGTRVRDVVDRILTLMGDPVNVIRGALPTRPDEILEMSADITAAKRKLGWQPRIGLDEGLRRTIAWVTDHRELLEHLAQPQAPIAAGGER